MAIHPHYAEAILRGTKHVEFRKRRLAHDIRRVIIYATSPVQQVVGEFSIREIVVDHPDSIWERFGDVGEIDRASFGAYYANTEQAVALVVGDAKRYAKPQPLRELANSPSVPQSFSYLPATA